MIKLRQEQVDILAQEHALDLRAAQIKAFRAQGMQVEDSHANRTLTLTDPVGHQAKLTSTSDGLTLTSGEQRRYHLQLDQHDQLQAITDPAGLTVRYQRDEHNRITAIARGDENITRFKHDEASHLTQIQHADQARSRFEYNADGQLTRKIDRNGQATQYQYTEHGQLAEQVDRNGHLTQFDYSDWDSPSLIAFPNGDRHGFEYDQQGRLQRLRVNDQAHAAYQIDEAGTIRVDYTDGTEVVFTHQNDQLVEAQSDTGILKLDYDPKGRLTHEDFEGQVIEYQRDKVGACTALITPEGNPIEYLRDQEQRVTQIKDWDGQAYTVDYHDNGALKSIRFPNQTLVAQAVTAFGIPSELTIQSPTQTISRFDYAYDACDRLIRSTDQQQQTEQYRYDGEGRLLEVNATQPDATEHFVLDANGNHLQSAQGSGQYNGIDQLIALNDTTYHYDGLGNTLEGRTANGLFHYQYNGRNQLTSASSGQTKTDYLYDALGRRIRKTDQHQTTTYVWAGQQLLSEETRQGDGELITQRDYLYFPNSFVPLAMRENGTTYYYHCGRRGEVLAMTDQQGDVVWQARYSAFGEAHITIETIKQPWRLAGHYYDEETALHYVLARYYQPQLGRFLSKDPLFHKGGSDNFYLYCDGDPYNRADPTGELVFLAMGIGFVIGAAIGAGIEAYRQDGDYDWGKIAVAAGIGGLIGAVGGGVGAAVEGAFAVGTAATVGGGAVVGGVSGVTSSIAEQCVEAAFTGGSISPGEVLLDGIIGAGIGAITSGVGGWLARRARKGVQDGAEEVAERIRKAPKKVHVYTNLKEMDKRYIGEETGAIWGTKVKYLDDLERQQYQLHIRDGKIYDANGKLFDTENAKSAFGGQGNAIFVMDEYGSIYASTVHSPGKFHHSSFLAGQPVASAGEIVVENGIIKEVTRRSGHYQPTSEQLDQFTHKLNENGVSMENVNIGAGF